MLEADHNPSEIEAAHFESGLIEVMAPNPGETLAMPFEGPTQWVKDIVARRQNERRNENYGD